HKATGTAPCADVCIAEEADLKASLERSLSPPVEHGCKTSGSGRGSPRAMGHADVRGHRHVRRVLARSAEPSALSAFEPDLLPDRNCEPWPLFFARTVTCELPI